MKIEPLTVKPQPRVINWDLQPLGIETDEDIAEVLNVSESEVARARRRRFGGGIDWDSQPLGVETDCAIAERLGVTPVSVLRARKARGIPPAPISARRSLGRPPPGRSERTEQFWNAQPLGVETDYAIAKRLGVSISAVWQARKSRGIPAVVSHSPRKVIPFLGKMPDAVLARELGVSRECVRKHRERAGIPKFQEGKDGA